MYIKQRKLLLFAIIVFGIVVMSFSGTLFVKHTSTSAYCNSCHVMNEQYESWFLTGLHRNITCVDCHLPNNNIANHLLWKGIDGLKDLFFFHTGLYKQPFQLSGHGKKAVQNNCIRCHNEMVSRINNEERKCWHCHRRVSHKTTSYETK